MASLRVEQWAHRREEWWVSQWYDIDIHIELCGCQDTGHCSNDLSPFPFGHNLCYQHRFGHKAHHPSTS